MPENETPNQDGDKPKREGCKRALEHLSTVLPFSVLEKMADKPLKIRGVAMTAGMSRNLSQQGMHVQKTKISLPNGSVIEAFPNNPDTIRRNTFHRIWWDEVNFTANDEDLYDAILFTLGTTNGKLS
jgi:phage terminase large subunit-like protein